MGKDKMGFSAFFWSIFLQFSGFRGFPFRSWSTQSWSVPCKGGRQRGRQKTRRTTGQTEAFKDQGCKQNSSKCSKNARTASTRAKRYNCKQNAANCKQDAANCKQKNVGAQNRRAHDMNKKNQHTECEIPKTYENCIFWYFRSTLSIPRSRRNSDVGLVFWAYSGVCGSFCSVAGSWVLNNITSKVQG